MRPKKRLSILNLMYFLIGAGLIVNYFLIEPISIESNDVRIVGTLTPSDIDISKSINFEEKVYTYKLESGKQRLYVVSPTVEGGLVYVEGKLISLALETGVPSFVYSTNIRRANEFERYGLSRDGVIILVLYSWLSLAAFLYESRAQKA